MQANLERGKAASGARSVSRLAILASVSLIGTLALCAPDRALATCGAGGGGMHAATARPPTSGGGVHAAASGGGGGGGSLGCANGSSASALHGLPMAASGRVLEGEPHTAAHTTLKRTATTRTADTGAHTAAHTTAPIRTATTTPIRTATTRTPNTGVHLRH
jgi:hypothetical protein